MTIVPLKESINNISLNKTPLELIVIWPSLIKLLLGDIIRSSKIKEESTLAVSEK